MALLQHSLFLRLKRGSPRLPAELPLEECREVPTWNEDLLRIGDGKCSTVSPASSEDASTEDSCSMTAATDSSSMTLEEVNAELSPLLAVVRASEAPTRVCIEGCSHWSNGCSAELRSSALRSGVELGNREEPDGCSISSDSVLGSCEDIKDL